METFLKENGHDDVSFAVVRTRINNERAKIEKRRTTNINKLYE